MEMSYPNKKNQSTTSQNAENHSESEGSIESTATAILNDEYFEWLYGVLNTDNHAKMAVKMHSEKATVVLLPRCTLLVVFKNIRPQHIRLLFCVIIIIHAC